MPRASAEDTARSEHPGSEERYINRLQLREIIPASDMTVWRWERDPDIAFPAPVKLGANGRNYWWLPTIRAWMRRREERSRSRVGPAPDAQR